MRPRADPATDVWCGVKDAKKRKQIQDRLAQRARRQRLATSGKKAVSPQKSASAEPDASLVGEAEQSTSLIVAPVMQGFNSTPPYEYLINEDAALTLPSPPVAASEPDFISVSYLGNMSFPSTQENPSPGFDHYLLTLPSLTIYAAMYTTGRMLGIPCVCSWADKSKPAPPEIPLSLQPLPIQLNNVHFLFIDRFPLPQLRQNMIELQDYFNAEEFVADLFTVPSFTITSGYQCWDPEAWAVAPAFKQKWEFLF